MTSTARTKNAHLSALKNYRHEGLDIRDEPGIDSFGQLGAT